MNGRYCNLNVTSVHFPITYFDQTLLINV